MDQKLSKLVNKQPHQLTEEEWDARNDARTLADAEIIKQDTARLERAKLWAQVLVAQDSREVDAMKKIANA